MPNFESENDLKAEIDHLNLSAKFADIFKIGLIGLALYEGGSQVYDHIISNGDHNYSIGSIAIGVVAAGAGAAFNSAGNSMRLEAQDLAINYDARRTDIHHRPRRNRYHH